MYLAKTKCRTDNIELIEKKIDDLETGLTEQLKYAELKLLRC